MCGELKGELPYGYMTQQDCSNLPKILEEFLELFQDSPSDSDHHLWNFRFHGESIFVFGIALAYTQRKTKKSVSIGSS